MSRLYDALQRADRERKTATEPEDLQIAEPMSIPGIDEPLGGADTVFGRIVQHLWTPSLVSLPTLLDRGAGVEQFRRLRSHIYQLRDQAPLKTILVCSGMVAEGKSFVAANLAISLARNSDHRVLLIDGDQRRSTLHNLLGAPNVPGLSEYLGGGAEMNDIVQRNCVPKNPETATPRGLSNLTFIPAGMSSSNSSEIVASRHFEDLIATLTPHFDWVVIDSPPVLAVTDAVDLARAADGVLLVARGASTPYDVAQRAQAAFASSRILGFVLNDVKGAHHAGSYYYYYGKQEADGGMQ
jgi:protein-tyrosine kinase